MSIPRQNSTCYFIFKKSTNGKLYFSFRLNIYLKYVYLPLLNICIRDTYKIDIYQLVYLIKKYN